MSLLEKMFLVQHFGSFSFNQYYMSVCVGVGDGGDGGDGDDGGGDGDGDDDGGDGGDGGDDGDGGGWW